MSKSFSLFLTLSLLLSACAGETLPSEVDTTPSALVEDELTESDPMVEIALVALEDDGVSGPLVGCGDSIVSVFQEVPATSMPATKIHRALSALFDIESEYYGESGLYNALYQSDLYVDLVEIDEEGVTVSLKGTLLSGGVCDDPRFKEQLLTSILDNSGMALTTPVEIFINGTSLDSLLNGKGE